MPDWDEILTRDGPAVWRTAYRIVGNRADADECVQEAFLSALRSPGGSRSSTARPSPAVGRRPRRRSAPQSPSSRTPRNARRLGHARRAPRRFPRSPSRTPSCQHNFVKRSLASRRSKPRPFVCTPWRDGVIARSPSTWTRQPTLSACSFIGRKCACDN